MSAFEIDAPTLRNGLNRFLMSLISRTLGVLVKSYKETDLLLELLSTTIIGILGSTSFES